MVRKAEDVVVSSDVLDCDNRSVREIFSFVFSPPCSLMMPDQVPRRAAAAKAAHKIQRVLAEEQASFDRHTRSPESTRVVESVLDLLKEDTSDNLNTRDVDTRIINSASDANARTMAILHATRNLQRSCGYSDSGGGSSIYPASIDLLASTETPSSETSTSRRRNAHQRRREARQLRRTSDQRPSQRTAWRMSSPIYSPLVPCHLYCFDSNKMKPS